MLLICTCSSVWAQWFTTGNIVGAGDFLGSTNNQPLNFRTNNNLRYVIDNGGLGNNAGRAIFSNDATGVTPAARLHLHQTGG